VQLQCHREVHICHECLDWLGAQRDKQVAAQSGTARITGTEPIFRVADVPRAIDHYLRLGFKTSMHDDTYAFAHRDDLTIHLAGPPDDGSTRPAGTIYLHVTDADELAADWRRAGMHVDGPMVYDYGKNEGSHVDPDGNTIRFGSPARRS
jgi:catechol 2,3-dioxygenase-like lactoylglutathione lyase family enzyme